MTTVLERKPKSAQKHTYKIYDCDHHYYETPDAFLRHLPKEYKKYFQYVEVNGRTKLAVNGRISDYIPNPTFEVVAAPGTHEKFFRAENPEGLSLREMTELAKSDPSFHSGPAHLKVMDEQGIHAAYVFPTLASIIEVNLGDRPDIITALFSSLNKWVAEEYGFTNGRQFPVAAISLSDPEWAIKELEGAIKAGARAVLVRPAPVPTPLGGKPMGHPDFDPFWARCAEAKILVTNHVSDSGYDQINRWWNGTELDEWRPFEKDIFREVIDGMGRAAADTVTSFICHGVFDRHPNLRIAAVESGSAWVDGLYKRLLRTYKQLPKNFKNDPIAQLQQNLYVMPFYEDSVKELSRYIPMERILFGSDWPHPEGLREPLEFFDFITDISEEEQKMVMCDNMKKLVEGTF